MKPFFSLCILLSGVVAAAAQVDRYWNATPNDVNNLLKSMKGKIDTDYAMDVKSIAEVDTDPEKNPILYRSGHYNFAYTPAERKKLREYLLAGGMIIYNTGLGSAPFYRSAKRELAEIFPEQPLQRLGSDHPIFHAYHDVDRVEYCAGVRAAGYKGNEPWFDGIEINCRVVALVSRWGMAVGWEGAVEEEFQAYQPDSAYQLGVNIFSYASSMRAWARNAAQAMTFVDKEASSTDKVMLAQVVYDGVWRTRHAGLSVLLQTFNRKTDIPVKFALKELRLSDPSIFNAPLLYLTGHEYFELNAKEKTMLRDYLNNGGFLFAEACCGRKGFDLAFRRLMQEIMPTRRLLRIDPKNSLFSLPNDVRTVGVTPTLAADLGKNTTSPWLEGLDMDGHFGVIYSPLGLAGGWEMSQSPYARGCNAVGSLQLGQNVLMYAVTQ
ncbi:MAG: DUF4159 domain-containing protein [Lentisphaerae bacterium]|nr:DUF4159 domain-containing protein [Lentisphaerota bacterium]